MAHVKMPMIDAISRKEILLLARTTSHLALVIVALSDGNEKESLAE
jgi:hypothetical protein